MRIRAGRLAIGTVAVALAIPAAAAADTTLGTVTAPTGSTATPCPAPPPNQLIFAVAGAGLNPAYTVPANSPALEVTHWQLNVDGVTAGAEATFVVARVDLSAIVVLGTDTETLTAGSLPSGNIEDFKLAVPIGVQSGDVIGVYVPGSAAPGIACYWTGGDVDPSDSVSGAVLTAPPTAGESISSSGGDGVFESQSDLNLGATLAPLSIDAALSLSAGPAHSVVGQPSVLIATVTNNSGPAGPITFTEPVPAGLTIDSTTADGGTCATNAPVSIVTCSFPSVGAGQSAKAAIIVTPTAAQTYVDTGAVAVAGGGTDPDAANNTSTATLVVAPANPGPSMCVVPKLGRTSVSLAKRLLGLLGCKVGAATKVHSKSVAKGLVIGTSPGAGAYAAQKTIALKVSSGPAKKPRKHTKTTKTGRR
jgi:hypothetical protein